MSAPQQQPDSGGPARETAAPPVSPQERAAQSYRAAEEDAMLAALKHETVVRTSSYREDAGCDPPRNSPPSLAAGAFGKYASAVAAERHLAPLAVMGAVDVPNARDALPSEEELAQRLAEQAEAAASAERSANGGVVARGGVAAKLQSAAVKFARMVAMDKAPTEARASECAGAGTGAGEGAAAQQVEAGEAASQQQQRQQGLRGAGPSL
ncbi:hypothetical protein TSOC_004926 [Tetrabaena socialis]|uniref:Uncharacterized protein n=1 Tax=Tetrabaena socialis TaxID=47790 RepID=A0A2J8A7S7_9CHLO|nr:hypothetical protein TSOC_013250 [Tetrabaena socialis]PNH08523.1 hypothetical protein TSOC_004926 [Tetrabaena socialis]|eukprot:PNH00901.1 hypothetical protein TSOC_013250 [Tetrabaena socialis]